MLRCIKQQEYFIPGNVYPILEQSTLGIYIEGEQDQKVYFDDEEEVLEYFSLN